MNNILIIGNARHGKDTVAEMIRDLTGLDFESSSVAAARIFITDRLSEKYGYKTAHECFEDRVNHRAEWHDLICEYNKDDKAALAKEILKTSNVYVGMRSNAECEECMRQGVFGLVIGVYDPRKEMENKSSFDIDILEKCDIIIPNSGTLEDLYSRVLKITPTIQYLTSDLVAEEIVNV